MPEGITPSQILDPTDPSIASDMPAGAWWLFSDRVARGLLPDIGVSKLVSSASNVRQLPINSTEQLSLTEAPTNSAESSSSQGGPKPCVLPEDATTSSSSGPFQKEAPRDTATSPATPTSTTSQKLLADSPKRPTECAFEKIAKNLTKEAKAKNVVSDNPKEPCVLFWYNQWGETVLPPAAVCALAGKALGKADCKLNSYVCQKVLMREKIYTELPRFGQVLSRVHVAYPDALQPLDQAVLLAANSNSEDLPDWSFLSLDDKSEWFTCPLYLDSLGVDAKNLMLLALKLPADPPAKKLNAIVKALNSAKYLDQKDIKALSISKRFLENPGDHESFPFMVVSPPGLFQLSWNPSHIHTNIF